MYHTQTSSLKLLISPNLNHCMDSPPAVGCRSDLIKHCSEGLVLYGLDRRNNDDVVLEHADTSPKIEWKPTRMFWRCCVLSLSVRWMSVCTPSWLATGLALWRPFAAGQGLFWMAVLFRVLLDQCGTQHTSCGRPLCAPLYSADICVHKTSEARFVHF